MISSDTYASCTNLLRMEVRKRLGHDQAIFDPITLNYIDNLNFDIKEKLKPYGDYNDLLKNQSKLPAQHLETILSIHSLDSKVHVILSIIRSGLLNKDIIQNWMQDLYKDIIVEMQLGENSQHLFQFENNGIIREKYIISVILERSKQGGFSGDKKDIVNLDDELKEEDFTKILKEKKYIYDIEFEPLEHGHLIHLFHIDFIIYILKRSQIAPTEAAEIYAWLGGFDIIKGGGIRIMPAKIWRALFDSTEDDFSCPEILNPILKNYFRWTK